MKSKLIGRRVYITDPESIYFGEWGIIADYDGEVYYIKIANGNDAQPIFDRDQFRVPRSKGMRYSDTYKKYIRGDDCCPFWRSEKGGICMVFPDRPIPCPADECGNHCKYFGKDEAK